MPRVLLTLAALGLGLAATAPRAHGAQIVCAPVQRDAIFIDGLLSDWRDVQPVRVESSAQLRSGRDAWSGPSDLSFDIYCNVDGASLYLAIHVHDEYFVRTRRAKGDDHLRVRFGARTLVVHPGDLRSIPARVSWGKRGRAKGVRMAEAMQKDGYSVELKLALRTLPGYRRGAPSVPLAITVADSDSKAKQRVQSEMSTGPSRIVFAQQDADLARFLQDKGYRPGQIRKRKDVDVVGDRRVEQVLLVGRTLGVIGEDLPGGGYFYLDLPVRSAHDVKWLHAVDLTGDRKAELLVRYVERAATGYREVLAVFRFDSSNKFVRPLAQELRKGQGSRWISNRFTLKPMGRKKRRRMVIVIDKPTAKGFSAETFQEQPASDCYPILLPWGDSQKRAFRFDGDEFAEL